MSMGSQVVFNPLLYSSHLRLARIVRLIMAVEMLRMSSGRVTMSVVVIAHGSAN